MRLDRAVVKRQHAHIAVTGKMDGVHLVVQRLLQFLAVHQAVAEIHFHALGGPNDLRMRL